MSLNPDELKKTADRANMERKEKQILRSQEIEIEKKAKDDAAKLNCIKVADEMMEKIEEEIKNAAERGSTVIWIMKGYSSFLLEGIVSGPMQQIDDMTQTYASKEVIDRLKHLGFGISVEYEARDEGGYPLPREYYIRVSWDSPTVKNEVSVQPHTSVKNEKQEKKGSCYIATACYGDYDHPSVQTLRRFRDEHLLENKPGMWFVNCYYALSPRLAQRIGKCAWLSCIMRKMFLEPFVRCISYIMR